MASNYTQHVQLPLWEPDDDFLREEFNEANEKIDAALGTIPRVAMGTYAGTGTYGAENPCSLTFDFVPRLVVISPSTITDNGTLYFPLTALRGCTQVCSNWNTYNYRGDFCVLTWVESTLTWYTKGQYGGAGSQYNVNGQTYCYLAIG